MSQLNIEQWLKSGEYLPKPFRDFHRQKSVFKAIHQSMKVEEHQLAKDVTVVAGHCYVIDVFLWWMARRGYTLQRTRRKGAFRDLDADVQEQDRLQLAAMASFFKARGPGTSGTAVEPPTS